MSIGVFVEWTPGRKNSPRWIIDGNGCHIWTGDRNPDGYARVKVEGKTCIVARVRYEREIGPIPEGYQLDHYICDNGEGGCCNPLHCRPVTARENALRSDNPASKNAARTHCPQGHELVGKNLVPQKLARGVRDCAECRRVRTRAKYQRNKIAINAKRRLEAAQRRQNG